MNGHFLSQTRRLNRHYQSGKRGTKPYVFRWTANANQWRYNNPGGINPPAVGDFFDSVISIGTKLSAGYRYGNVKQLNWGGTPLIARESKAIFKKRPYAKVILTMKQCPPVFEDTGAHLYVSIYGASRYTPFPNYMYSVESGTYLNQSFSIEGDESGVRTGSGVFEPISPQVRMDYVTHSKYFIFVRTLGPTYTYCPVMGRGALLEVDRPVHIYIKQDYSTQDIEDYKFIQSVIAEILLDCDYMTPYVTAGVEYDYRDVQAIDESLAACHIFTTAQEELLTGYDFVFEIKAEAATEQEFLTHMPNYVLQDSYNI